MGKIQAWIEATDEAKLEAIIEAFEDWQELADLTEAEQEELFTKHDSVKNRLELIEPKFIEGIGKIVTFGAEKYSAHNWKKAGEDDIERIKGALLRHILAYLGGQELDPETGESHLYHAACNLMFLDYFDRNKIRTGELECGK